MESAQVQMTSKIVVVGSANTDFVLQLEIPLDAVQAAVNSVRVILSSAPPQKLSPEILKSVDYLTPNEIEAALLAGENPSAVDQDSLPHLASRLGVPLTSVDTMASGDALPRGESLPQAVRYANAAGAMTAARPGAQPSLSTRQELDQFMVSSATGPNPADRNAVPSPNREETSS